MTVIGVVSVIALNVNMIIALTSQAWWLYLVVRTACPTVVGAARYSYAGYRGLICRRAARLPIRFSKAGRESRDGRIHGAFERSYAVRCKVPSGSK